MGIKSRPMGIKINFYLRFSTNKDNFRAIRARLLGLKSNSGSNGIWAYMIGFGPTFSARFQLCFDHQTMI